MTIRARQFRRLFALILSATLLATACSTGEDQADDEAATEGDQSSQEPGSDDADDTGSGDGSDDGDGDGAADQDDGDGSGADDSGEGGAPQPPPLDPTIGGTELFERLSSLPGRLALGNGPEVAIARPDGRSVIVLDGSESVLASQPTWSRDGARLAWSSVSAERQIVAVESFDGDGLPTGEPERSNVEGQPVFYLQWSRADDRLVYIRNAAGGGAVEVGLIEPGLPGRPIGQGAPFFVSWSPAPDRIAAHVNEASIDLFNNDAAAQEFGPVLAVDGGFSAPDWVDGDRALVVADGALSYLDVTDGSVEPIEPLAGPIRFVLSPDRTKVAYQVVGGAGGVSVIGLPVQAERSGLIVLDLESGERTVLTADVALAWEWSPDSDKLAWLTGTLDDGRPTGRWGFWSGSDAVVTTLSSDFVIGTKYGRNYLPFFAQYAQSVTGWSPDSSAFAFAGRVGPEQGVWIQLVDEIVAPQLIASGDFVTWGDGQPPPPTSGGASAA